MVDPVHPLRHLHGLLLAAHRLHVVAHDVEPGKHAQALGDLGVHRAVGVVQQIQRLRDQLVAVLEEALLYLGLAGGVEVIGVSVALFVLGSMFNNSDGGPKPAA